VRRLLLIFAGRTKQALSFLMHAGCPGVDERDEQGDFDVIHCFYNAVLLQSVVVASAFFSVFLVCPSISRSVTSF